LVERDENPRLTANNRKPIRVWISWFEMPGVALAGNTGLSERIEDGLAVGQILVEN
jgi:hypothetical protein